MHKRRLYFMRDTRSWIFQYVVPVIFVLVGMLVMRVRGWLIDFLSCLTTVAYFISIEVSVDEDRFRIL